MKIKIYKNLVKFPLHLVKYVSFRLNNWIFTKYELKIHDAYSPLKPVLVTRLVERRERLRLTCVQVNSFIEFVQNLNGSQKQLQKLQHVLPKTTIELLISIQERDLPLMEAEQMAQYLSKIIDQSKFENLALFDENISIIIGREWHEIDYSGDSLVWQRYQRKYQVCGVTNFRTLENIAKFFPMESTLPYFNKAYCPRSSSVGFGGHSKSTLTRAF